MHAKHLILDIGVIVDLWADERSAATTRELLAAASDAGVSCWLAASALAKLDDLARGAIERRGRTPEDAAALTRRAMTDLLSRVSVLTIHGFEQAAVYVQARRLDEAQVAAAARSLGGGATCIVTENRNFDTLGEVPARTPAEALAWLRATPPSEVSSTRTPALSFVDLAAQQAQIRPEIERRVEAVLRHGRYILGPEVEELERRLADYVGVRHCIGVSSGTDALLIALMALEIGPGDEVITTPFTFIATGEMIALLGATPVFVDIDPRTYNIDPGLLEAAIGPRTRAIMPVSLYGQCADLDAINAVAQRHRLPVIEDAAQSLGATYKGRRSCGLSTVGCTSFFPSKPLGAYGDGGACFTDDDGLALRIRQTAAHGQDRRYHHCRLGINGRLDTLQAAILLAKLDGFAQAVERRGRIGQRYTELLAGAVQTPYVEPHNTSVYAQYTVQVDDRDALGARLAAHGIPTAVHYPVPLPQQPALNARAAEVPVAGAAAQRVLSLPMSPWLSESDQDRVVEALRALRPCA